MTLNLSAFLLYLHRFWPAPLTVSRRERALSILGVGLGLLVTEFLSRQWLGGVNPWFVAPMGASAVLLFAAPASPLAQPWSMLGGNLVSAAIGVACVQLLGPQGSTAALAAALAVTAMFALRCLHPPGGAMALTAVLGGPAVHQLGWALVWQPVALNCAWMLLLALLYNRLAGRHYPHALPAAAAASHAPGPHGTRDRPPSQRSGPAPEDLDAALASFGEWLDIDRQDLADLLDRAQHHAMQRRWGGLRCADVMSRDLVSARIEDTPAQVWQRLQQHRIKAMPVLDARGALVGIVSLHDFFVSTGGPEGPVPRAARTVADLMSWPVRCAQADQSVLALLPAFADGGQHHMPVLDAQGQLQGMITQSDLVAALFRAGADRGDGPGLAS